LKRQMRQGDGSSV